MRRDARNCSDLHQSNRRATVLLMVIAGHFGLLLLMLRPPIQRHAVTAAKGRRQVLTLRFFPSPHAPSAHPALPAHRVIRPAPQSQVITQAPPSKPPVVKQAAHADVPFKATLKAVRAVSKPIPTWSGERSANDGGFQAQLFQAQHSRIVRGVPGSDTPLAPGIHLLDPMHQGIGAVMRKAQRAFGVANRHCIDVDVWHHLTPQELSEQHISPAQVDEVDRKYGCNEPPGLRF